MLLGEYEHALDDKNRVTLPARFREAFADGVFVARGIDPCLLVYPPDGWTRFVDEQMAGLNPFSREARQMSRYLFAGTVETDLDKQGRVMLPPPLLEHAKLRRGVVVAGVRDHLELWDPTAWRREIDDVGGSADLVAERLAAKQS
ncbi:MAG TPA: division/cell wall cluster transcriptional repressor MraZ [Gaiellaceae bacterium]|jgi:MraZ protein|nr:division/cell wall cluster transcriptional repressor MraZ [Gaiellaceae bacterium]